MRTAPAAEQAPPLLVRHWMTTHPVTMTPGTSVLNARRLLATYRVRHLPVVDGGQLAGMLSERDLRPGDPGLAGALAALRSDLLDGRYRCVDTLMSAPVVVATAAETIEQASGRMVEHGVGALPVVEGGRLVGVLSMVDCLRALLAARARQRQGRRVAPAGGAAPRVGEVGAP